MLCEQMNATISVKHHKLSMHCMEKIQKSEYLFNFHCCHLFTRMGNHICVVCDLCDESTETIETMFNKWLCTYFLIKLKYK